MPKISIALAGRNDNYGNQWLNKLGLSIKSIQRALKDIDYEIVLLDYNPPKDKPLLSECFSADKYYRIKHVVFSNEDHLEFIESHCNNKCRLFINNKIISKDKILKYKYFIALAFNMAIKNCIGKYILSTGSDNIFPDAFGGFIKKLESNIMYRSPSYLLYCSRKTKIKNISVNSIVSYINKKKRGSQYGKKFTILKAAGNFILMDSNSWKKIGGYLPTINPRLYSGDNQIIFHGLSLGKKIKATNFYFLNLDFRISNFYKKIDTTPSNYTVYIDDIKYDHQKEIGVVKGIGGNKEWRRYCKWAKKTVLELNKEYNFKVKYEKRFKEVQKLFKSFLPEKFLLN